MGGGLGLQTQTHLLKDFALDFQHLWHTLLDVVDVTNSLFQLAAATHTLHNLVNGLACQ